MSRTECPTRKAAVCQAPANLIPGQGDVDCCRVSDTLSRSSGRRSFLPLLSFVRHRLTSLSLSHPSWLLQQHQQQSSWREANITRRLKGKYFSKGNHTFCIPGPGDYEDDSNPENEVYN